MNIATIEETAGKFMNVTQEVTTKTFDFLKTRSVASY